MYIIFLGIIGFLALVSFFDRSILSLALLGIVVLLALLIRKLRQLTNQVGILQGEVRFLQAHSNAEKNATQTQAEEDRSPTQAPIPPAEDVIQPSETPAPAARPLADGNEVETELTPTRASSLEAGAETDPHDQSEAEPEVPLQAAARSIADTPGSTRPVASAGSEPGATPAMVARKHNWFDRLLTQGPARAWAWFTGADRVLPGGADAIPGAPTYAAASSRSDAPVSNQPFAAADVEAESGKDGPDPQAPPPAPRHNWFDRLLTKGIAATWGWITGGNVFVRVGILILFMGMTFLIRFAIGENLIPIELRLAVVGAVAIALLVWGWRQRDNKANFALVVQGGGIGLLYLTIFASFSLYRILDSSLAFVMLGIIVVLAAIMAIKQNARSLALFAVVGGFLAPILTSSGSNNFIGLFSYYTLLNLGIFAVAWFKSWRILNLTGFIFTFAISGIWGLLSYYPIYYSSTQPFLIIFFLLYVGISILFALRRSLDFKDTIDSSLVFGTPLLAFGMQSQLVADFHNGIAISAFALAAFYLVAAMVLWKAFSTRLRLLCETFVSLAVIFATLAIPFAIDASLTGSIWAIEGAGILWVSIRQRQFYRRLFAVLLMLAAGAITGWEILLADLSLFLDKAAFANSVFISATLIAVSAAIGSWLLSWKYDGKRGIETIIEYALLAYSTIVMLAGFGLQIIEFSLFYEHGHLLALLAAVTGSVYALCAQKLKWKMANWMSLGYFSLLLPAAVLSLTHQPGLSENHGYWLWPGAMIALFYSLQKIRHAFPGLLSVAIHLVAAGLLAMLLFWEGIWQLLLGYSLLSIVFCKLGEAYDWREIRLCSILFLPVLVLCFIAAVGQDGDLITLSSIGSEYYPPLQPGGFLWPLAFATYFYLLWKNPGIGNRYQVYYYLGGALLVAVMLLWLGLWTLLLGATVLCWLAYYLAWQFKWTEMRLLSKLLLPLMIVVPIAGLAVGVDDPVNLVSLNLAFQITPRAGFFLWPLAFFTLYLMYWLSEKAKQPASDLTHAASCLFLVGMTTWEISRLALERVLFLNAWHLVLLPIVGLIAIKSILQARHWPFNRYQQGFERYALLPLAAGTVLWSLLQFSSAGKSSPLVWVPLLNPIDAMQCLILYGWITQGRERLDAWFGLSARHAAIVLAGFVFLWINIDIMRFVHHWAGVSWDFSRLVQADLTQTLMSLVWSLLGLAGTFLAARKQHRQVWIMSAALLAVVVLKLFVIDLSAQDTIERIVSFTGVGLLLTFVGYFSPIPPRQSPPEAESEVA